MAGLLFCELDVNHVCFLAHRCQDVENQDHCEVCPAGYYCVANSTTYVDQVCPSGHYCPDGTQYDLQFKCGPGTYNNYTGRYVCVCVRAIMKQVL